MGHVIVCGLGQVGYRVSLLLLQIGESVHVVTQDARPGFVDDVEKRGGKVIIADARDHQTLSEANVMDAKAIIACTSSDLTNIEISLDARTLNPTLRIVTRIFDQNLAIRLKESVGIDETLAMSLLAAPKFAAEALREEVLGQFNWNNRSYNLVTGELPRAEVLEVDGLGKLSMIENIQKLAPVSHRQHPLHELKVFCAGIPRIFRVLSFVLLLLTAISVFIFCVAMKLSVIDSFYFVVTTLTTTGYGDITVKDQAVWVKLYACWMMILGSAAVATLYSVITDYIVSARFSEVLGSRDVDMEGHVVVVGVGNVGFRVCQALVAAGVRVVAIDTNNAAPFRSLLSKSIPFLVGDARESETLKRASVHQCQAIISTTNDDAVNLSVGLAAKKLNHQVRTVLRLFDEQFASKVETNLDIDRALSASLLSAPGFVSSALFPNVVFSFIYKSRIYFLLETNGKIEARSLPLNPQTSI